MKERVSALAVIGALLITAGAVFGYRLWKDPSLYRPGDTVITLTGSAACGVWTTQEINGLNYWWKEFEPAVLNVAVGEPVVLRLQSVDVMHQFYSPRLDLGPVDVKPGHVVELRFAAAEPGVHQFYCTSICGCCHYYMRGWIVVTAPGEDPIDPPPILCPLCLPDFGPPPEGPELTPLGEYLYLEKGCSTCHGFEGRGGIVNENSTIETAPAHDRTAEKFFLQDPDEAETFVALLQAHPGLADVERPDGLPRYRLVKARYDMALDIVRKGKYTAKLDPDGPEPPLQMAAWQYILTPHQIDSLLAYFVTLMPWDEDEDDEEEFWP